MQPNSRKYLWEIYDASAFLITDNEGIEYEEFVQDRRLIASALHHLLVIGEACRILRDNFPSVAAQIPESHAAIGMRNVIAHEYSDIDYQLVWQTIQKKLVPLRDRVSMIYQETP
jgi:uncharacterized protein with HEPN domain